MGKQWKQTDFIFLGSKITVDGDYSHEIKRRLLLGRKAMKNLESMLKSRVSNGFSSSCVWMWELDHEEGWVLKNWCFQTVVLEKTLESPLDNKESQIFIRRTHAETEAPILWPFDAKSQLIGKDPDTGKDWGQEGEEDNRGWDGWMASLPLRHLGCGRNGEY